MLKRKASFVISIDLELAWGVWDKINQSNLDRIISSERLICNNLLKIFDEYKLPVTWAVVSALLDENNKMINAKDKNAWFAPDILESILCSNTKHLVASHSYSHKEFKKCLRNEVIEDFEKSYYFFNKFDLKTDTLVFPRNQVHHLDVLKKFNFKAYRSIDKSWYRRVYDYNKFLGRITNLIDKTFPIKSNSVIPKLDNFGLIEIPTSILLISKNGIRRIVSNFSMYEKIKDGIDLAINCNECFHLWFHPSNFYFKTESQFNLLKKIMNYVNLKREQGLIEIKLLDQFN